MQHKLRAVIYCRVSTSSDAQVDSLDKQVAEAVEATEQLGFDLVDRFIDEGQTGTTSTRKEYSRMLGKIEEHSFDVIVTKSLDRMNRNILDFYLFLDLIIKNQIKLYFYLDRAYYKPDDKIVIGIKAILAEEYSRELSKKLSNAHTKRQERGEVIMLSSLTYGYKKELQPDGKKKVVIVEKEAKMIRLIFDCCKEGYGARAIGKILYANGYRNRNGNEIGESTIRRIIRNPLVTGTMIMNKVKYDFNTKTAIHTDSDQWMLKEHAVPAIISKEDWKMANALMDSRVQIKKTNDFVHKQGRNKGKYNFSGKLICGICGKPYYKTGRWNRSSEIIQWKCSTYLKFGRQNAEQFKTNSALKMIETTNGCDGPTLDETLLIKILGGVAKEKFKQMENEPILMEKILSMMRKVLEETGEEADKRNLQKKVRLNQQRQEMLLEKYLEGNVSDDNYRQMEERLKKTKDQLEIQLRETEDTKSRIYKKEDRLKKMEEFLKNEGIEQAEVLTCLDFIKNIVVFNNYLKLMFVKPLIPGSDGYEDTMELPFHLFQVKNTNMAMEQSKDLICLMIKENPKVRLRQMAQILGMGERTVFKRVAELKKEGKIERKGRGPGSRWYIKN